MILHETGVADAVICSWHTNTAARLLDHDGEDEAVIKEGLLSNSLDAVVDVTNLWARIIWLAVLRTRAEHDGFVVVEPGLC